jgi:hypothetical protein
MLQSRRTKLINLRVNPRATEAIGSLVNDESHLASFSMLSLFKRKPPTASESTFKTRVQRFWTWYSEVAVHFYKTIESGDCKALAEEVSAKVRELVPGFAWVFGPGENGQGHSFTLSGEGNLHRQLLAIYWLEQAPKIDGWTFTQRANRVRSVVSIWTSADEDLIRWSSGSLQRLTSRTRSWI